MATAADLIKGSLRLLGVLASGETPSADMQADGLITLNEMLESWAAGEKLTVQATVREEFTLAPSDADYTMGASGNFNTTRPVAIERATIEVQDASPYEVPVEIIGVDEWAAIADKAVTSSIPSKLYIDWTATQITLNLWPVPSAANKLVLYSQKPISSFAASDTVSLKPGFNRAIRYNLAIDLAPEYGRGVSSELLSAAIEAKSAVKRAKIQETEYLMECEPADLIGRGGSYDINIGE